MKLLLLVVFSLVEIQQIPGLPGAPPPPPHPHIPPFGPPTSQPACGKPQVSGLRVVGGHDAVPHSWPWQVLLINDRGEPFCGGSIISAEFILTAGHCVAGSIRASRIRVGVGLHDWRQRGQGRIHKVKYIIKNKDYDESTLDNDIAMLKLRTPIMFNKHASPICLPSQDARAGTRCFVTGWGSIRAGLPMHHTLQQAVMPIVDQRACKQKHAASFLFPVLDSMLCAGDGGWTPRNGCQGDSGGPLSCYINGRWELHGAVSYGDSHCRSDKAYTVFARITRFQQWIKKAMSVRRK